MAKYGEIKFIMWQNMGK